MYKVIEKAIKAKAEGKIFMASIVKNVHATTYYNVQKIDDILTAGKWIPAQKVSMMPWHGRIGISGRYVDWEKTVRK